MRCASSSSSFFANCGVLLAARKNGGFYCFGGGQTFVRRRRSSKQWPFTLLSSRSSDDKRISDRQTSAILRMPKGPHFSCYFLSLSCRCRQNFCSPALLSLRLNCAFAFTIYRGNVKLPMYAASRDTFWPFKRTNGGLPIIFPPFFSASRARPVSQSVSVLALLLFCSLAESCGHFSYPSQI